MWKDYKCIIYGMRYDYSTNKTWYGDIGVSCHIYIDDSNMYVI